MARRGAGEHALLASACRSSLPLALQHSLRTIAFPAISTGVYGFPPSEAATVAVAAVRETIAANADAFSEIVFRCFSKAAAEHHRTALADLRGQVATGRVSFRERPNCFTLPPQSQ
jgi:O-acetyl-ADP-ribose deacetylase (regulator of RNase III)